MSKNENLSFTENDFYRTFQHVSHLKNATIYKMVTTNKLSLHRKCLLNNTLGLMLLYEATLTEYINDNDEVLDRSTHEDSKRNLSSSGSDASGALDNSMDEKKEEGETKELLLPTNEISKTLKRKRSDDDSSAIGPKEKSPRLYFEDPFIDSLRKSLWANV